MANATRQAMVEKLTASNQNDYKDLFKVLF